MKTAMEKAFSKIKNLNVRKLEEPKQEKPKKGELVPEAYDNRPCIYLDSKELSTIGNYKVGDKVILVIECSIRSINTYDRMNGKEAEKSLNCDLLVEAIADITKG